VADPCRQCLDSVIKMYYVERQDLHPRTKHDDSNHPLLALGARLTGVHGFCYGRRGTREREEYVCICYPEVNPYFIFQCNVGRVPAPLLPPFCGTAEMLYRIVYFVYFVSKNYMMLSK
jgi:hypothetical protein